MELLIVHSVFRVEQTTSGLPGISPRFSQWISTILPPRAVEFGRLPTSTLSALPRLRSSLPRSRTSPCSGVASRFPTASRPAPTAMSGSQQSPVPGSGALPRTEQSPSSARAFPVLPSRPERTAICGSRTAGRTGSDELRRPGRSPSSVPVLPPAHTPVASPRARMATSGSRRTTATGSGESRRPEWSPSSAPAFPRGQTLTTSRRALMATSGSPNRVSTGSGELPRLEW